MAGDWSVLAPADARAQAGRPGLPPGKSGKSGSGIFPFWILNWFRCLSHPHWTAVQGLPLQGEPGPLFPCFLEREQKTAAFQPREGGLHRTPESGPGHCKGSWDRSRSCPQGVPFLNEQGGQGLAEWAGLRACTTPTAALALSCLHCCPRTTHHAAGRVRTWGGDVTRASPSLQPPARWGP